MLNLNAIRIAKTVAIVGFLLPWVLVSCDGEPAATLSGFDLAFGNSPVEGGEANPVEWVLAAMVAAIAGLVVTFAVKGRSAVQMALAAAIIGLATAVIGVETLKSDITGGDPDLADSVTVERRIGYWVSLAGFAGAIAAAGLALSGSAANGRRDDIDR